MSAPPAPPPLPRLVHPDPVIVRWSEELLRALSIELGQLRTPAGAGGYTLTSATPVRSLNPTTATATQAAQVLAAVITDLQAKGSLA